MEKYVITAEINLKKIIAESREVAQALNDIDVEKFEHDKRYQNMVRMWGRKIATEKYKEFVLGQ